MSERGYRYHQVDWAVVDRGEVSSREREGRGPLPRVKSSCWLSTLGTWGGLEGSRRCCLSCLLGYCSRLGMSLGHDLWSSQGISERVAVPFVYSLGRPVGTLGVRRGYGRASQLVFWWSGVAVVVAKESWGGAASLWGIARGRTNAAGPSDVGRRGAWKSESDWAGMGMGMGMGMEGCPGRRIAVYSTHYISPGNPTRDATTMQQCNNRRFLSLIR